MAKGAAVADLVRAALPVRHPSIGIPVVIDPTMPDGEFRIVGVR